jgi:hypothetical protein
MTKVLKKRPLTDHQKKKYQQKLSHFLKGIKYRNGLLSKELAEIMGYTAPKFYEMESDSKPHGRFINSLDFLSSIASLENMSLTDFAGYLEGKQDRFEDEEASELNRKLYSWEKTVLEAMDPLSMIVRREFVEFCKESTAEGKTKLEVLLEVVNLLKEKDLEAIKSLRDTLKHLLTSKQ